MSKAKEIACARWGPLHANSLRYLKRLGHWFSQNREYNKALLISWEISAVTLNVPERDRISVIEHIHVQESLGACYFGLHKYERAKELQEKVVNARNDMNGDNDPSTVVSMALLVHYMRQLRMYRETVVMGKRVFSYSKGHYGGSSTDTLNEGMGLAQDYMSIGQKSASLRLFQWLADTCLEIGPSPHP